MAEEEKDEKRVGEEKQQLVIELAHEPVEPLCELEEEEEEDDDQLRETPIIVTEKEIHVEEKEGKEKEKQKEKEKNEINKKEEKREEKKKSKSELARDKKKESAPAEGKEVPYPLVPSRKDKKRHLARFLDIFKKLEITMPFREALQKMPLYSKFMKDMLTRKSKYIHSDTIVVEGNYSAMIQRILPPKHNDLGVVTIPCSIGEVVVGKALIDLGASINLMPLSMCR